MLIVEDDPLCVSTWKRIFAMDHWSVVSANSLAEARRAIAESEGFLVALLDMKLPDGHGVDLVEELSAMLPKPRILVLSGELNAEVAEKVFGRIDALVPKPVPISVLRSLVFKATRDVIRSQVDNFARRFRLSTKERELLHLVTMGADNRTAARRLECKPQTLNTYWKRILSKTNAHSQRDVVVRLYHHALDNRPDGAAGSVTPPPDE
jgi:DNA-binding NarL/FixJ family response regulator